jgi:NAD(P)-dependent dehydrogenase (short-subunit alcohol dehydrogenase family)
MNQKIGRVAAVTGGRRGIGRAIALALAAQGWSVVVIDLQQDAQAQDTLDAIRATGSRAAFVKADISIAENAGQTAAEAFSAFGGMDALVNNAGVQVTDRSVDVLHASIESFDRLMDVNMRGTFFLTQAFANGMLRHKKDASGFSSIITISSANALHAKTRGAEYCISKAGLSMMNKILALQLAPHGIACYEVQPGLIKTEMNASMHAAYEPIVAGGLTPIRRWGFAEDVGATVATLAGGGLPFATGETLHVDGGLHIPKSPFESPFVRSQLPA